MRPSNQILCFASLPLFAGWSPKVCCMQLTVMADEQDFVECPVCGTCVEKDVAALHVEQHFHHQAPSSQQIVADETVECTVCGKTVSLEELDDHEAAHR